MVQNNSILLNVFCRFFWIPKHPGNSIQVVVGILTKTNFQKFEPLRARESVAMRHTVAIDFPSCLSSKYIHPSWTSSVKNQKLSQWIAVISLPREFRVVQLHIGNRWTFGPVRCWPVWIVVNHRCWEYKTSTSNIVIPSYHSLCWTMKFDHGCQSLYYNQSRNHPLLSAVIIDEHSPPLSVTVVNHYCQAVWTLSTPTIIKHHYQPPVSTTFISKCYQSLE